MGYKNLQACVADLQKTKQILEISEPVDGNLEVAVIHRRVYQNKGPALLFTKVKGSAFPVLANLFGTLDRTRFLFRDTIETVKKIFDLKIDPFRALKNPLTNWKLPFALKNALPKKKAGGPVIENKISISGLPQIVSWPKDGGAFITLPEVYTEDPTKPGFFASNMGMYRVQISGNQYSEKEIGLHYQIHRGIGVHHQKALQIGHPLKVNIFVGGTPAMMLSSVMPLPEGMPEISFAGILAGHRIPFVTSPNYLPIYAEADFCIEGEIHPTKTLPEGPFGDHLGYYSLQHEFPVLEVKNVYHKKNAIWPHTTVGRPPQEDTSFGEFIHELTGPVIPTVIAGIKHVHAVDAAGVHPLLLAIGSERYTPYSHDDRPAELLTQANAILGQGQLSLAKYLFISNHADNPDLKIHNIEEFFKHVLERVDMKRDLHFQTSTTMDTLDYTGGKLNEGSKLVIAARGNKKRDLAKTLPVDLKLPDGFSNPKMVFPGVVSIEAKPNGNIHHFCEFYTEDSWKGLPLVVLVDNSSFTAQTLNNFLWVTFTRSEPAKDVYGVGSFIKDKHWGCAGALVVDARLKNYQAPSLEEDVEVLKRVETLGLKGKSLYGFI